jgi:hypothetical protein
MELIYDLVRKLIRADLLMFSLLRCSAFLVERMQTNLQMVFKISDGMLDLQSLRSVLITGDLNHSLSPRSVSVSYAVSKSSLFRSCT